MKHLHLLLLVIFVVACSGGKSAIRPPESVLDTPEGHYKAGMRKLDEGETASALVEFRHAQRLDTNYPGAYVGFALLESESGNHVEAHRYLKTARSKDDKWVDVSIAEGRVLTQEASKDWLKKAQEAFDRAVVLASRDDRIPFYRGAALRKAGHYQEAENAYGKTIDLRGNLAERAQGLMKDIQESRLAAPGTDVGIRVAKLDPVTRADLCALLIDELKLEDLVDKRRAKRYDTGFKSATDASETTEKSVPADIAGHWAEGWIQRVLDLEIAGLKLQADGNFHPGDPVTRKDLAQVLQEALVLVTGETGIRSRYVGVESRFPDVRDDVYYYNAAALAVDRGLMQADGLAGEFRPGEEVSGADAVLGIKRLQSGLPVR